MRIAAPAVRVWFLYPKQADMSTRPETGRRGTGLPVPLHGGAVKYILITAETTENGRHGGGYTVERWRWYFPHNKKQAWLSSSRACYFCSKYLEKSCITLDINNNSFTSYSFSAFIIRAISKSRSVVGDLLLMLFFSVEAPSR